MDQEAKPQAEDRHRVYPWVGQQDATGCAAAALAMIARFHGRDASPDGLRERIRVGPRGTTLLELQRAAEALGFRCCAVRLEREHLSCARLPAIAHLVHGHYVVLYANTPEGIVLGDPARGVRIENHSAFAKAWAGCLLLLAPPEWATVWTGNVPIRHGRENSWTENAGGFPRSAT